jgi:hypothetical protein
MEHQPTLTPQGLAWFWHRQGPNPSVLVSPLSSSSPHTWKFANRCTCYDSDVETEIGTFEQYVEELFFSAQEEEKENEWSPELDLYDDCDYEFDS